MDKLYTFFDWFHRGESCRLLGNNMMGGSFMMIIYGALIIYLIYLLISKLNMNKTISSSTSALEILDKEFAKGNISEEEYIRRKDLLK